MRILLTGAFGNLGTSTLAALEGRGHDVRCFDIDTPVNRRGARRWQDRVEIHWGDLRDRASVETAMADCDIILHVAAIIPPVSERQPELAHAVNVEGTETLVTAARVHPRRPHIVGASSVSVYGPVRNQQRLRRIDDPVAPTDHYSRHKLAGERILRSYEGPWSILRLGAVMPLRLQQTDPLMFETALDSPVEIVHTLDAGLAFANAADAPDTIAERTLHIGGGPDCRFTYREFYARILGALGIGMLPEEAFGVTPFYTHWMETEESEALLAYQRRNMDDYLNDLRRLLGWRRAPIRVLRPWIRRRLLAGSPYWRGRSGEISVPTSDAVAKGRVDE